jgi:16S rRNA (adenine1518-N6/adenine1519-N6)-dimethyltransferase
MAHTKSEITAFLASLGMHPRHRFGQNFMVDQNLVRTIAASGEPRPSDLIIEIGPGTGTLTETLLESGASVLACEIDRDLARLLRERLGANPRFQLIEGDALSNKHALNPDLLAGIAAHTGGPVKLVANLPYHIASPLIIELLLAGVSKLVFTVQKEVADRLRASAGEDAYGPLSVTTALLASVEVLRTLPPSVFWPPPSIDSALVRLSRHPSPLAAEPRRAAAFVQQLFSYRRKMLRKALTALTEHSEAVLAETGIDGTLRCEELPPAELLRLHVAVAARG